MTQTRSVFRGSGTRSQHRMIRVVIADALILPQDAMQARYMLWQFHLFVCLSVRACERSIRAAQCSNLWLTSAATCCPSMIFCHARSPLRSRSVDICHHVYTKS